MSGKITIRDVAREAGVGVGTVSRVLNNNPQVSEGTRRHVLETIEQLGFKPNAVARQLPRKTRFKNIGVITRPFYDFYSFAERLRGVQHTLKSQVDHYELILFNTQSTDDLQERLTSIIQTGAIEGLIIIDLNLTEKQQHALQSANIPFVGLNHVLNASWPCISTDNVRGGYLATRYLLELGHRRIGYVGDLFVDEHGFVTSDERYRGHLLALEEYGIEPQEAYRKVGRHDTGTARRMTAELLQLDSPPTAIFAMSDTQALGCIAAAQAAGLQVPEELSVIGYDDLEISQYSGLSTVRQHLERSGMLGMRYLLRLLNSEPEVEVPTLPELKVIPRATTQRLRATAP